MITHMDEMRCDEELFALECINDNIEYGLDSVQTASEALSSLQGVKTLKAGEAESIRILLEAIQKHSHLKPKEVVAVESSRRDGAHYYRMAQEGLIDAIKGIFEAIINAVKKFGQWVGNAINKLFGGRGGGGGGRSSNSKTSSKVKNDIQKQKEYTAALASSAEKKRLYAACRLVTNSSHNTDIKSLAKQISDHLKGSKKIEDIEKELQSLHDSQLKMGDFPFAVDMLGRHQDDKEGASKQLDLVEKIFDALREYISTGLKSYDGIVAFVNKAKTVDQVEENTLEADVRDTCLPIVKNHEIFGKVGRSSEHQNSTHAAFVYTLPGKRYIRAEVPKEDKTRWFDAINSYTITIVNANNDDGNNELSQSLYGKDPKDLPLYQLDDSHDLQKLLDKNIRISNAIKSYSVQPMQDAFNKIPQLLDKEVKGSSFIRLSSTKPVVALGQIVTLFNRFYVQFPLAMFNYLITAINNQLLYVEKCLQTHKRIQALLG